MNPWFLLAAMSLATFIMTKLVVDLDFPPVLWLRDRVVGGWRPLTMAEHAEPMAADWRRQTEVHDGVLERYVVRKDWVPVFFAELLSCPWCVSAWVAAGVTAGVWAVSGLPLPVLYWAATWALGALLAQHDYA